jgi:hypothetical protein
MNEMEIDWIDRIPRQYQDLKSQYTGKVSNALPPLHSVDHAIDIQIGKEPPWGPINALSEKQLSEFKQCIKQMLDQGKIRPSKSPAGAPILFVPNPDGRGLQLCVDYRELNMITTMNTRQLPMMNELQDRTQGAKVFTIIDLKARFHPIRIEEGDESKTAYCMRDGLYGYTVMTFGLVNAPETLQDALETIFRDMLDRGLPIYMDDFLIYSETAEDHTQIVLEVLC